MNLRRHRRVLNAKQAGGRHFDPVGPIGSYLTRVEDTMAEVMELAASTFSVRRKKDGVVVAENLTLEQADEMILAAKRGKKASLELV